MSSTNDAGITGHSYAKKMNLDTDFIPFRQMNSEWIAVLNVKCKTIKLEDNIEEILDDLGYGNDFLIQHQRHNPCKKKKLIHWILLNKTKQTKSNKQKKTCSEKECQENQKICHRLGKIFTKNISNKNGYPE